MDGRIELVDFIRQLRREFLAAMADGEGTDLRFVPGPVQLELTVAAEKAISPELKVRFWVCDAGTSATLSSATTQRITFTLQPRVGNAFADSPLLSGSSVPGER